MSQKSKVYQISDEEFRQIISNNYTYSDCLRALGLSTKGGSSTDLLKRRIRELQCSTSHFSHNACVSTKRYLLNEILVENSPYANIASLKRRLISEKLLEYKCAKCGIIEWNGLPLSLQLEHKNGKNNDHRLENLCFLCPNCHSQTETYAGKRLKIYHSCSVCGVEITRANTTGLCEKCRIESNKQGLEKVENYQPHPKMHKTLTHKGITRDILKNDLQVMSFLKIGEKYGVSDNSVRKWCKVFNLPSKASEIKKYTDEEWNEL